MISEDYSCLECTALLNFIEEHSWNKCYIRAALGEPDPTIEQVQDCDDAATMLIQHIEEFHK